MTATFYPLTKCADQFWEDWEQFNATHTHHHPLLQRRMIRLFIKCFPAHIDVLSLTQEGSPTALLLLRKASATLPLVRKGYLPAQSQIALAQVRPDVANLKDKLFEALPLLTQRLDLQFVDTAYQTPLAQAEGVERTIQAVDMEIGLDGDFQSYWQQRPKSLRKNITRYNHRITRDLGHLDLRITRDPTTIPSAVDRYGILESGGWKGVRGTAIHPDNQQGLFYRALLHEYATTDEAAVFELYHEDRLVASRLTVRNATTLVILKTAFDEDYKPYATGRILLYRMLEHLFSEKELGSVAFYTNATSEQLQWATESRPAYNVSFYRHPALARARGWVHRVRNRQDDYRGTSV